MLPAAIQWILIQWMILKWPSTCTIPSSAMKINERTIAGDQSCYLIAEIGHNHQGEGEKALELVRAAASSGADAVKFQKRENATLFSRDFFNSAYTSENSFGKTYGEHREFLEPKEGWLL